MDELEAKGIKRILAVSHNGYGPDMELAAKTHGVDLIVGGHSHSYLGDPKNPLYEGPYPTIIQNLKGENTLIVQVGHVFVQVQRLFTSDGYWILTSLCFLGLLLGPLHWSFGCRL